MREQSELKRLTLPDASLNFGVVQWLPTPLLALNILLLKSLHYKHQSSLIAARQSSFMSWFCGSGKKSMKVSSFG